MILTCLLKFARKLVNLIRNIYFPTWTRPKIYKKLKDIFLSVELVVVHV